VVSPTFNENPSVSGNSVTVIPLSKFREKVYRVHLVILATTRMTATGSAKEFPVLEKPLR
jgi:hypothetical protein